MVWIWLLQLYQFQLNAVELPEKEFPLIVQVISGVGIPSAWHSNLTISPGAYRSLSGSLIQYGAAKTTQTCKYTSTECLKVSSCSLDCTVCAEFKKDQKKKTRNTRHGSWTLNNLQNLHFQNAPPFIIKLIREIMNIHEHQAVYFMNIYD